MARCIKRSDSTRALCIASVGVDGAVYANTKSGVGHDIPKFG